MRKFQLLVVVSLLLIFAACRTDPDPAQSTVLTFVDNTGRGNIVTVTQLSEAESLNPVLYTSAYAGEIVGELFHTLQTVNPETLELEPFLIKDNLKITEIQRDGEFAGIILTFEIIEEAKWPNGTAITGEDYVFSLKAIMNPEVPANHIRPYFDIFEKVVVDSENPRKVTVTSNSNFFLNEEIITSGFFIMPKYHYDPNGLLDEVDLNELFDTERAAAVAASNSNLKAFAEEFTKPYYSREPQGVVGSGAFKLKEWQTGQRIEVERVANWWGEELAKEDSLFEVLVDGIIYRPINDQIARTAAMKDNQLDAVSEIASSIFNELKGDSSVLRKYNLFTPDRFVNYFWCINTKRPKLSDKRVRRAIAHVVDVDGIIEDLYDGALTRITGPILPNMPGYNPDLKPIPFDIEAAKTLLAEAGWNDSNNNGTVDKVIEGNPTELVIELLTIAGIENQNQQALIIKEEAIKAGIGVEIIAKESNQIKQDVRIRDFDLYVAGTGIPSPTTFDPKQAWHTESDTPDGYNRSGFGTPESDALIDAIRTSQDATEREELYQEFQEIIYDEQPLIFLWTATNFVAIHKRFDAEVFSLRPNYSPSTFELVVN